MSKFILTRAFGLFAMTTLLWSCKTDNGGFVKNPTTGEVNTYIHSAMETWYFWDKSIPSSVDTSDATDPFELFESLRNAADREWSQLTDDVDEFLNSLQNESTSFGYQLLFGEWPNHAGRYYAIVDFVYADTPASEAGLRRGDIITRVDGQSIDADNYLALYHNATVALTLGRRSGSTIEENTSNEALHLTARLCSQNPVVAKRVITTSGGKRVGYLFYSDYAANFDNKLKEAFAEFKAADVTDLILDLRSNGGGSSSTAELMMSMTAPSTHVLAGSLIYQNQWNDYVTGSWREYGSLDSNTKAYFDKNVATNLDLGTVYVLTGPHTASASEMTIVGLQPYMNVVTIGSPTHGKYCGGTILPFAREVNGRLVADKRVIGNWAMYLITFRYANKNGYPASGYNAGLPVTHAVTDDYACQPGEENDPLLSKALSLIDPAYSPSRAHAPGTPDIDMPAITPAPVHPLAPGRPDRLYMDNPIK